MLRPRAATAPEGFETVWLSGAVVWVRPETEAWVREALSRHSSLYEAAVAQCTGDDRLEGRAPVYVVNAEPADRVVRHYVRGGVVASLLGDRYLRVGRWRPMLETTASEHLRSLGLATPRVLAAAAYPLGPIYRGDLVTEYVPTRGDVAHLLFEEVPPLDPGERRRILRAVGEMVGRLAKLGVRHPDANVKNFLVDSHADALRVHLLDLDRCRFGAPREGRVDRGMGGRLVSSLRKWETLSGHPLSSEEWAALHEGIEARTLSRSE